MCPDRLLRKLSYFLFFFVVLTYSKPGINSAVVSVGRMSVLYHRKITQSGGWGVTRKLRLISVKLATIFRKMIYICRFCFFVRDPKYML